MKKKLLDDFKPVSKAEWKEKIVSDLKGRTYESLVWENEGLTGEPIYTQENLDSIDNFKSFQNNSNSSQPEVFGPRHWTNYQLIVVNQEEQANTLALEALNLGADGIVFQTKQAPDFVKLLKGIMLEYCAVSFELTAPNNEFLNSYLSFINTQGIDSKKITGFIISNHSFENPSFSNEHPNLKSLNINLSSEFKAVTAVQELALLLHSATTKVSEIQHKGAEIEGIADSLQFQIRFGKNYFIEIAKIRALRILAQSFWKGFNHEIEPNQVMILAASNDWSEPTEDKYNHLIGATTSAMSAIIGGCTALLIRPFSNTFDTQPALAMRNARNISTILKEESYLNKTVDPSAGSYFIESTTNQIIEKAWSLFLKLEAANGNGEINSVQLNHLTSEEN